MSVGINFYNPMINTRLNDHGTGATGANRGFGFANKILIFRGRCKCIIKNTQNLNHRVYRNIGIS